MAKVVRLVVIEDQSKDACLTSKPIDVSKCPKGSTEIVRRVLRISNDVKLFNLEWNRKGIIVIMVTKTNGKQANRNTSDNMMAVVRSIQTHHNWSTLSAAGFIVVDARSSGELTAQQQQRRRRLAMRDSTLIHRAIIQFDRSLSLSPSLGMTVSWKFYRPSRYRNKPQSLHRHHSQH